jgi:hypothetical protein
MLFIVLVIQKPCTRLDMIFIYLQENCNEHKNIFLDEEFYHNNTFSIVLWCLGCEEC